MKKPASEAAGVVRNTQVHYARMMELVYLPDSKSGFCGFESHFGHHQTKRKRYFMNLDKMLLENRISLLRSRNPVVNANIIHKLERRLRKMN